MSTTTTIQTKTGINGATKNLFKGKTRPIPANNYAPKQTTATVKKDNT